MGAGLYLKLAGQAPALPTRKLQALSSLRVLTCTIRRSICGTGMMPLVRGPDGFHVGSYTVKFCTLMDDIVLIGDFTCMVF
jgi:hypothetical protein